MKALPAKLHGSLGLWLGVCMIISGCGTVKVPITVTHPAEINMAKYKQVAISRIDGKIGNAFADGLKERLVEHGEFTLVDRSRFDQIMKELHLSNSDLVQNNKAAQLGKLLPATAIIAGRADEKYDENVTTAEMTCYRKKTKYPCRAYTRTGTYLTSGSIDIIDVATAQILKSKSLECRLQGITNATNGQPEAIDVSGLRSACIDHNMTQFIKAITRWTETVQAPFQTDGAIPKLETGVNMARIGDMQSAATTFRAAAREAEMAPNVSPKTIAKAYFNLGLAYQYSDEFGKAMEAFKKSYGLDPSDSTLKEIKQCEQLQREKRKLDEHKQGAERGK